MSGGAKREVAGAYDALGGRIYDLRYSEEQEAKYKLLLKRVRPDAADVVLDVGCGTGLLLMKLHSRNVGVDVSPGLISAAKSRAEPQLRSDLVLADAEGLPFREAVFDKVYSVTLIQNTPDPDGAVTEMKRVSRPGSKLAITALRKGLPERRFKSLFERARLTSVSFVLDDGLKDWIAFADR